MSRSSRRLLGANAVGTGGPCVRLRLAWSASRGPGSEQNLSRWLANEGFSVAPVGASGSGWVGIGNGLRHCIACRINEVERPGCRMKVGDLRGDRRTHAVSIDSISILAAPGSLDQESRRAVEETRLSVRKSRGTAR